MYNFYEDVTSLNNGSTSNTGITYPFIHQNQPPLIMIPHPPNISLPPIPEEDDDKIPIRDERQYPQWSDQEIKDFIEIRAQVECGKRTKNMWKIVVKRLSDKGYKRTIEQCKCKWKNLVNRYKGLDAMDIDNGQPCPFFSELHAVFTARANRMQQARIEAENSLTKGKKKRKSFSEDQYYLDFSDEQESEEETGIDQVRKGRVAPKKKKGKGKQLSNAQNKNSDLALLQETLREFFQQQQMIDLQMQEMMEKRQRERNLLEQEWRETMEKLERERMVMEQAWREKAEQRKLREESRAERRDALLTALLNKLIRDEDP